MNKTYTWIGPTGFTPGLGRTFPGREYTVPGQIAPERAEQLVEEGKLRAAGPQTEAKPRPVAKLTTEE